MNNWKYKSSGLPDDYFIRTDIPMTKSEVRAVVLSKLRLQENQNIYDIGAGSGSISVEIALLLEEAMVYAVERKKEAVELINKNLNKFKLDNVSVIESEAPAALAELPAADRVFIGGSGDNLAAIIKTVDQKLTEDGRIVLTAVTINTLAAAVKELENLAYELEICNISVTRTKNIRRYHMFEALTPVYIIAAQKNKVN